MLQTIQIPNQLGNIIKSHQQSKIKTLEESIDFYLECGQDMNDNGWHSDSWASEDRQEQFYESQILSLSDEIIYIQKKLERLSL